jgi:hypothetical protein
MSRWLFLARLSPEALLAFDHHLLVLRRELEMWQDTPYVKALDEQMVPLLISGR